MKKLSLLSRAAWLVPCLLLLWSCRQEAPVAVEAEAALSPEIRAAQQWVEQQGYAGPAGALTLSRQHADGRTAPNLSATARWGSAWVGEDGAVEVPLALPTRIAYSANSEAGEAELDAQLTRLLVLQDKKGEPFAVLMHLIGDPNYLAACGYQLGGNRYKRLDQRFSGTVLYTYPDGSFCYGWRVVDGRVTGAITRATAASDAPAAQRADAGTGRCEEHFYIEFTQDCVYSPGAGREVCSDWYVSYFISWTICLPDDLIGGGGGGGGTGIPQPDPKYEPEFPCEQAAALASDTLLKKVMEQLKDSKEQRETACYYTNGDLNQDNEPTIHTQEGNIGDPYMDLNLPTNPIDMFAHYHYESLRSIFSGADIYALYQLLENGKISNTGTFTFGLVTAKGTAYLLMIDNVETFRAYGKKTFGETTSAKGAEYALEFILSICGVTNDGSIAGNEIGFLHFLRTNDTGLSLFVGRYDNFSTWTKKEMDSKTGEVFTPLCP